MTPVDPLFIVLPILEANSQNRDGFDGVFMMLDDLLDSPEFPDMMFIRELPTIASQLSLLCDIKNITPSEFVFRLSEKKTLDWLEAKVESTLSRLTTDPEFHHVHKDVFFLDAGNDPTATDQKRRVIVDMVGEYLSNEWLDLLLGRFDGFSVLDGRDSQSQTLSQHHDRPEDYVMHAARPLESSVSASPAKKAKTAANRALAKANIKGMKSMMCYFGKKT
ncbi:hypothetical protein IWQ60_006981 [Tieghemiomyces parasiticus]|uniref:Ribonuclease H2 subunit B wHTH domain-containing protein n=1 Tax=Tieghemiomyces parasiticus TaxID=78921 RepID=A0A9W8A0N2_9FUNG|nr:hypothetical protein IWQ60_006981 [Tieghemiomyces parasiticus]